MFPTCLTPHMLALDVERGLPRAEPRPLYAAPAECIDPAQLARQEQVSGSFDQEISTDHFLVVYDASNAALDEATLDVVTGALERSWTVMVDEHGWAAPSQTESCLITVLLGDLSGGSSGTGGWTNVNEEGGVPFIVLNTDWFADGDDWIQSLIAHEFNHASQFDYNVFWDEQDWWYWESTAEWSFELPYPDANTWTYSLWSYFDAPYLALDSDTGYVNYGHFTFNTYLSEQVDPAAPRLAWEAATADTHVDDAIVAALGTPFDEILAGWTAHVASMDVAEGDLWLAVMSDFDTDPYTAHVTTYPSQGSVTGKTAPQGRGQNFFELASDEPRDLWFTLDGAASVKDVPTDWAITVSTETADGTIGHATHLATDGYARVAIDDLGGAAVAAYVGVIPLNDIGERGASYTWSVAEQRSEGDVMAEEPAACGCQSGAAPAGLGLLVATFAARRRAERSLRL
ncbi:MAG: hypothetical protein FJ102_06955 [Deltaproteobacteria bacterium]|nr:hypothetical protein [Deltaproteobacteria bacterium]